MLIPLKTDSPDADIQEWALVELQGRIEPMQEPDLQQALQVGTLQLSKTVSVRLAAAHNTALCRPSPCTTHQPGVCCCVLQNKDVVQLQVGYHIIEGKRVPLKKPMAILETVQQQDSSSADAGDSSSSDSSTHCKVSCLAVWRRPQPSRNTRCSWQEHPDTQQLTGWWCSCLCLHRL
jgi:hypothetical protein